MIEKISEQFERVSPPSGVGSSQIIVRFRVRYTICTYYPNLTKPDKAYPFAVLAASPKDIALVGVNVADAHDLEEKHPLAAAVAGETFEIMVRRIETAMLEPKNPTWIRSTTSWKATDPTSSIGPSSKLTPWIRTE